MGTIQRIKQYIDFKGINNKKFEESVGFSNGSFASQLKNDKTIGVDKLENILNVYSDLNPTWLLTGDGDMLLDFSKGITGGEDSIIDKEFNDIRDELSVLNKLILSNHKIKELNDLYENIDNDVMLLSSYLQEYNILNQMSDVLGRYQSKQIKMPELKEMFKIEFQKIKELYQILEPYQKTISELLNKVSEFNNSHNCFFSIEEN